MDRIIVLVIFLCLSAIIGGAVGRFFNRPDLADLVGTVAMAGIGACVALALTLKLLAVLRSRRQKDHHSRGGT